MLNYTKKSKLIICKEHLLKLLYFLVNTSVFKKIFLNKIPKIYNSISFTNKSTNRLVLFSTYNTDGKIKESLLFYLAKLKELKTDIVLIDTSPSSIPEEIEKTKPFLRQYIWRENLGYDFGSWKVGFSEIGDWKKYNQIIITNDSIFGPIYPLAPIFEKFDSLEIDVWGLTDSYELSYHLMSYFLVFQNKIIQSKEFENFWNSMVFFPTTWKKFLILSYEIGGTKYWKKHNFKTNTYIKFENLTQPIFKNYYNNPTHVFWEKIISKNSFPFLKKDLVRTLISTNEFESVKNVLGKYNPEILRLVEKENSIN